MTESCDMSDRELARLCELLECAATPERRTDMAIRICDALGVSCARAS